MSNTDLLSKEETAQAAAEGWSLKYVYDLKTKRWSVMAFPYGMNTKLMAAARRGSALHIKALQLCVNGL